MKVWNFKRKSTPMKLGKKLETALGSVNGFVFHMDRHKNDSITFNMRKRILYAWYWIFLNSIIVNGELLKTDTENETEVKICFTRHFLVTLIIYTHLFLGLGFLLAIFSGISSDPTLSIFGGMLLVLGIVLWIAVEKKFDKDIQKYKTLINEIFRSNNG